MYIIMEYKKGVLIDTDHDLFLVYDNFIFQFDGLFYNTFLVCLYLAIV